MATKARKRRSSGTEKPWFIPDKYILDVLNYRSTLISEACQSMLVKVLRRIPYRDLARTLTMSEFVLIGSTQCERYTRKAFGWRHPIFLGEGLLALSEEEQVKAILPQAALGFMEAPHAKEKIDLEADLMEVLGKGEKFERRINARNHAEADLKIDVREAWQRAERLAQSWQEQWEEYQRPEA